MARARPDGGSRSGCGADSGKLPTPSGTLLDADEARLQAGTELGALEEDKGAEANGEPGASAPEAKST